MKGEQFYNWISASHKIFETFEDRKEVYIYCLRWVDEYFEKGRFTFTEDMKNNLLESVSKLYIKDKDVENFLKLEYRRFIVNISKNNNKLAFAYAPYLMFWNVRRFEEYFKVDKNFNLVKYFEKLNEYIRGFNTVFKILRGRHILDDDINKKSIKILLGELNQILKNLSPLNQNEYIMAIKILHIIAPYYFPLLDNPIIEALKKVVDVGKDEEGYLRYIKFVRDFLTNYYFECKKLESEFNLPIIKLLDEALYVRYSMDLVRHLR